MNREECATSLDDVLSRNANGMAALRGQTVIVKVGGSIQDVAAQLQGVINDVALMSAAGVKVAVIHGGGKAISAAMAAAGLTARFVAGQRYTDAATLRIAERTLARGVNAEIVAMLQSAGAEAMPLHSLGTCVLGARRSGVLEKGEEIATDIGFVGRVPVEGVNVAVVQGLMLQGIVPVVAPVALELDAGAESPGKLNINADLAAGTVARALRADLFILVSDTPGIRRDPRDPATAMPAATRAELQGLIHAGAIDGGMLPKVEACFDALDGGVRRVAVVDGRVPRSTLMAALGDARAPGTWVSG
ncbi:acetylglutamate kinase [soil metagenome]